MSSANRIQLNTPKSTETEIVGIGEKLLKYIWFWYYGEAKTGYAYEDI